MKRLSERFLILFSLILVLCVYVTGASAQSGWVSLRETDDGISVKARETPGTNVRAVMASIKVAAPPQVVIDAASDPDTFEKSGKYVEKIRVYKSETPEVWHVYYLVKFPVISRRDYTLRYEQTFFPDQQMYQLSWHGSTTVGPPPSEKIIRVTQVEGWFRVQPLSDGTGSLLQYYVLADPGGSIPSFLVNLANRSAVPDILRQVRDAALRRVREQP